ncbi:hypothetical protein [Streptomyces sp. OP7]|uniref:hypothetical protein n=1 Tax=Streptomyces sp. OP7 TaxID=3142462 RepID=UPI0032E87A02
MTKEERRAGILGFLLDRGNGALICDLPAAWDDDTDDDLSELEALLAEMVEEGVIRPVGFEVTDRTRHAAECCSCVV